MMRKPVLPISLTVLIFNSIFIINITQIHTHKYTHTHSHLSPASTMPSSVSSSSVQATRKRGSMNPPWMRRSLYLRRFSSVSHFTMGGPANADEEKIRRKKEKEEEERKRKRKRKRKKEREG
jgi:hypothetical protein